MFLVGVQFTSTSASGSNHPDKLAQQTTFQKVDHRAQLQPKKSIVSNLPGKKNCCSNTIIPFLQN
jgi:hypothetical protein